MYAADQHVRWTAQLSPHGACGLADHVPARLSLIPVAFAAVVTGELLGAG
jgi:hypothetical protein